MRSDVPAPEGDERGGGITTIDLRVGAEIGRITLAVLHDVDARLDQLAGGTTGGGPGGLVVRLGCVGDDETDLDLDEIGSLPDESARFVWAEEGQRVLRRIEKLPIPTVAAIEGRCCSGGSQIALACGCRIALDEPDAELGFPEVGLGVPPGWGGTTRLPRLIGVRSALDLLTDAVLVPVRRARSLSLVDDVCAGEDLEHRILVAFGEAGRRDRRRDRRRLGVRLVEETAPGRRMLYRSALRRRLDGGEIPPVAMERIVRTVSDAVGAPLAKSFRVEAEGFAAALGTPAIRGGLHAHGLIREEARAVERAWRGEAGPEVEAGQAAVVGGGVRGAFYADLLVSAGFEVRLKDVSREAGRRGAGLVRARLAWAADRKAIEPEAVETRMARLSATGGFGGFGRLEAVFETAVEDASSKAEVLREAEDHVRPDCLLVSTSAIVPLREIGSTLKDPSRLVGLHLLPVSGQLAPAEVVCGSTASPASVERGIALARRLGRVPICMADRPGLVLLRLTVAYVGAAEELVALGARREAVDAAMRGFGMPVGPFELAELLGRGSLEKSARALAEVFDERFVLRSSAPLGPRDETIRASAWRDALRRVRRGTGRGSDGDTKSREGTAWTASRIQLRILLTLTNEAARILDEGVVGSARQLDLALLLGLGFPRDRGGLLFWADRIGAPRVRELLARGPASAWTTSAPLLVRLAESNGRFYDLPDGVVRPAPEAEPETRPSTGASLDTATARR